MFSDSGLIFNRANFLRAFIFATLIFSAVTAFAMPGNFDRSFGSRGKVFDSYSAESADKFFAMALQADGKIVATGASNPNTTIDAVVFRYNPDGTPDESFGNGGRSLLGIDEFHKVAYALKIQTDGKIVIAGYKTGNTGADFFLARINTDGSLDNSFGVNGVVTTNLGTASDTIRAIALQNIGGEEKIVVAGSMDQGPNSNFVIARYNANGTLDESFATGGITFVSWGHEDRAEAIAIQHINGEDKIVVGGKRRLDSGSNGFNDDFALTRLNSNGTMDLTFGNNGKVNTNFAAVDIIRDLVIQQTPNGQKIVAAGLGNNNFALARYQENGSPDTTFGAGGKVQTSLNTGEDQIHDLFLLPDGRILAGGFTRSSGGNGSEFALVRYLPDGQIDPLFGGCGTITSNLGSPVNVIHGVAVQPNGQTIAAGYRQAGPNNDDFVVVRYTDNAAAAPTGLDFDGDGRTDTSVFRPSDGTWHMNRSCYGYSSIKFGLAGDKPVPADYDGDGKTDVAVYRDGVWYLQQSTDGFYAVQFGISTDFPTAGDFDDDGKADIAVFRPSNGVWYIFQSSDNQVNSIKWGIGGDLPVAADYDGDFKTDPAVFRPSQGIWYIRRSSDETMQAVTFGQNGDRPLVTDLDGDSLADFTVFRLGDRTWHTKRNAGGGYSAFQFGLSTDMPITGDYDGDGKTDHTVYRSGTWYYQQSKFGYKAIQFGLADDIPLTSR